MEYSKVLNIVNDRIEQGKIFGKLVYPPYSHDLGYEYRNYIIFIQPTIMDFDAKGRFIPMFTVLLDGSGRTAEEQYKRGGLGIGCLMGIEDLKVEDYADISRCLRDNGLKFNKKTNTIELEII